MKYRIVMFSVLLTLSAGTFAQSSKKNKEDSEEKDEKKAKMKDKTDYGVFHRQMLSLKEYLDERKKIPALQKANKTPVKVLAVIDSVDGDDEQGNKTLTGYIRQDMGDNSVNIYEVTYDRTKKKIVAVKRTQESAEADDDAGTKIKKVQKKNKEDDDDDEAKEKPPVKKTLHKKNKDDDDDDGDDDDNSTSNKKEKDDN